MANFYGKIIGLIIGFALAKLPGAILGLIAGHLFDTAYSGDFSNKGGFARFFSSNADIKQQAVFFNALFSALGHICKADGKVTPDEIAVASSLMDNMNLSGDMRSEAQQAFRDGKEKDFPLADMLKDFKLYCAGRKDLLQFYLEILISAACADGRISPPELQVLEKVSASLGFNQKDLHYLISTYEAEQRFRRANPNSQNGSGRAHNRQQRYAQQSSQHALDDAYKILGVSDKDDRKTIKRAYKKLMSTHHPDKLIAKGLPQQALEMAKRKTQDIQVAYELVKEKRSL